jgi:hypothetical protein
MYGLSSKYYKALFARNGYAARLRTIRGRSLEGWRYKRARTAAVWKCGPTDGRASSNPPLSRQATGEPSKQQVIDSASA